MRCWVSALAAVAVAGCSATAPPAAPPSSEPCNVFVEAWVGHFKANVARLDGQQTVSLDEALSQARQRLLVAGQDEAQCQRPYCIVQPRAGGRLDSYCGYRIADPGGPELYRWVPWTPARR